MVNPDQSTEKSILEAAKRVFHEKGLAGARMQQIADEAGINKALLHYYYRNKQQLFKAVFSEAFATLVPQINEMFDAEEPLFDKIRNFADRYMTLLMQNPCLPGFVINEINNNPKFAAEYLTPIRPNPDKLLHQIQEEVEKGNILPVNPLQLVINLLSLCIFPFLTAKMIQAIRGLSKEEFNSLLEERRKYVPEFIINAIKPRP